MIVKIKDVKGGWLIFDNIKEFQYQEVKTKDKTEKNIKICDEEMDLLAEGHNSYYDIYFSQGSRSFRFKTDRIVYILNDNGKTVDKLSL